jgi:hypothetical protein
LKDIVKSATKWKEEIDRLNAETDERIKKYLEEKK